MGLPVEINPLLLQSSSSGTSSTISNSLRFRKTASASLSRTPASSGSNTTWTWSAWLKRGSLICSAFQNLFLSQTLGSSANYAYFGIDYSSGYGNGVLVFEDFTSSASRGFVKTVATFLDTSAWYHIVLAVDTTQSTSSNRIKLYVNGTQITTFSRTSYPSQNTDSPINQAIGHNIGRWPYTPTYFDGYIAEQNFIDGQALTPSSFGSTNAETGVWQPIK